MTCNYGDGAYSMSANHEILCARSSSGGGTGGGGGGSTTGGGGFNWDMCTTEWVGTPTNGTPYTNPA